MDIPCLDLTRIRSAVETFVSRAGADWSAIKRAGKAVPLGDLLDGHPLCLVEVKNLTPQAVALRLQQRGIDAALPPGNPRQPLAGFVYGDGLRALIFLNRDDPFARRRFSLAHEIGHFMMHGGGALARATAQPAKKQMEYNPDRDDPREIEAHAFAAELLMPWEMVAHEAAALRAGTLGPQRAILALAARLQVSRQAAARRLAEWRGVD